MRLVVVKIFVHRMTTLCRVFSCELIERPSSRQQKTKNSKALFKKAAEVNWHLIIFHHEIWSLHFVDNRI